MNIVTILFLAGGILGFVLLLLLLYAIKWKRLDRRRSEELFFFHVLIPKKDSKDDRENEGSEFGTSKDHVKFTGVMTQLFTSFHTMRGPSWTHKFFGSEYFSCEYAVLGGQIHFYIGVPREVASTIEKQITSFYTEAVIEEVSAPNIFHEGNAQSGCYMTLGAENALPIKTVQRLDTDPLNNIANALSKIEADEGALIQFVCRPLANDWQAGVTQKAEDMYKDKKTKSAWRFLNPFVWIGGIFDVILHSEKAFQESADTGGGGGVTPLTQERVKAMEEKAGHVGFDIIVRLVTSAKNQRIADEQLGNLKASFEQFGAPDMNGFSPTRRHNLNTLVRDSIFRVFSRPKFLTLWRTWKMGEWRQILSSEELATIFHFPNAQYNKIQAIAWQEFKIAPAPHNVPKEGLLLGHNIFRGQSKEIRIKRGDRRRHFYAIGKSGTGKSTILEGMIRQDLQNGEGVCVVDPHGDLVEAVLPYIPRERADDVILFDPGDLARPMGLNMLEARSEDQKEFVAQEALAIFIKLFGEEVMGPRLQHYFRNGVLTLMSDPDETATLLDIPRLFTDSNYEKLKVSKVKNPMVRSFWEKEMAGTGQREKEEMIPYFSSKFGPFVTNAQIRNILGQQKSGFDFRDVMDNQKILLVNLSKGKLGDLNAKLLGMIIVSKIQMAAMSRVDTPEEDRKDFYFYVDEFQNFVTDSFASILSEARKYRLNLIVAHQYISQITKMDGGGKGSHEDTTIRDAVFGNVGSMMCFKIGAADAETMVKEFAPVFTEQDLINIANYQAYIKLNIDNATSRGFSMKTIYDESGADTEGAEAFRQLSRLKFGRDREFVSREIGRRLM